MKVSLFFPAYNEEANIEKSVRQAVEVLDKCGLEDYEVIVVNDGSKDRTLEIGEQLAQENPRVRVVSNNPNKGYGGALITGFESAKYPVVMYCGADLQFDLGEIPKFLEHIEGHDAVLGYRAKRNDPFIRRANAFMWGTLVKTVLGFRVKDVDCGFKAYKKDVLEQVSHTSNGAMIDTEVLASFFKKGFKAIEIPVAHFPRVAGSSTGANIKVIVKAFKDLAQLYRQINKA